MKMWPGRGGQMGGPRWPNGRKGDRGLQWPSVWKIFFRSGQNLQFMHDLFQFYKAFATKNFVVWENDSQSWNPCFLGVRSPNQLPKASWLGNLTTHIVTVRCSKVAWVACHWVALSCVSCVKLRESHDLHELCTNIQVVLPDFSCLYLTRSS